MQRVVSVEGIIQGQEMFPQESSSSAKLETNRRVFGREINGSIRRIPQLANFLGTLWKASNKVEKYMQPGYSSRLVYNPQTEDETDFKRHLYE